MQESVKIYEKGPLTLHRHTAFSEEIIDFLDNTVWGTEETLYEHLETAKRVKNIKNPTLITLRKNGEMLAMVVFIRRMSGFADSAFKCYFTRYLAADPKVRGTGLVARGSALTMKLVRADEDQPAIFYATVEAKNTRSIRIIESVDYEKISRVRTLGFNRLFPRKSKHVERVVQQKVQEEMLERISSFYQGHGFLNFDTLFLEDNYFIYREEGEIVAGVQAHKALWVISNLPGKIGSFIVNWAHRIPLVRRVVNPKRFEFVALEGIYYKEGKQDRLFRLIEHILTEFGVYSALFWFDERSSIFNELRTSGKLGMLNQFVKDSDTFTMASFENMTEEQIELIKKLPTYVSSYDFI